MLIEGLVIILATVIYFVPTFVAFFRGRDHAGRIGIVNFLVGWTLFGWLFTLIWAFSTDQSTLSAIKEESVTRRYRNMKQIECPSCKCLIDVDYTSCPKCGCKLELVVEAMETKEKERLEATHKWTCEKCGSNNQMNTIVCSNCGSYK